MTTQDEKDKLRFDKFGDLIPPETAAPRASSAITVIVTGFVVVVMIALTIAAITALMFPIWAFQGWVVVKLWTWFVPAALTTFVPSLWQAVGLMILIGVFRYKAPEYKSETEETKKNRWKSLGTTFLYGILAPLASLGVGAIVKFWIMKG